MDRKQLLIELTDLLNQRSSFDTTTRNILIDLRDNLIMRSLSEETILDELSKLPIISSSEEWWNIIKKKPIHKNLLNVLNGKITESHEVAKIVASMLTQLIIRKIADPSINYNLLYFDTYLELLKGYYETGEIDIDKFKSIIKRYESLGIVKEEDE